MFEDSSVLERHQCHMTAKFDVVVDEDHTKYILQFQTQLTEFPNNHNCKIYVKADILHFHLGLYSRDENRISKKGGDIHTKR